MDRRIEQVIAEHRPRLVAQARKICGSNSDAEDLVQETILRLLNRSDQFAGADDLYCTCWLFKTMRNLFVDRCRQERARLRVEVEPSTLEAPRGGVSMEAQASRPIYEAIPDEQFSAAIQALSPPLRAAFELHVTGQRYHEIARTLGIKQATVGKRIFDARAQLRKLLEPFIQAEVH